MRVTADTNIYISALNYNGPPRAFLELAVDGEVRLALSSEILDEIEATLRRKFSWPENRIAEARATLLAITEPIVPSVILDVVKDDPDDNKILECAQSAHSECIVSGDKDLLRIRLYDGIPIMTVAEFLKQFGAGIRRRRLRIHRHPRRRLARPA